MRWARGGGAPHWLHHQRGVAAVMAPHHQAHVARRQVVRARVALLAIGGGHPATPRACHLLSAQSAATPATHGAFFHSIRKRDMRSAHHAKQVEKQMRFPFSESCLNPRCGALLVGAAPTAHKPTSTRNGILEHRALRCERRCAGAHRPCEVRLPTRQPLMSDNV